MGAVGKFGVFDRMHLVTGFLKKTVSTQNNASINPLILNGSLLFVTVFGGARREGFPVTPAKTPVSFRFARNPNETWACRPDKPRLKRNGGLSPFRFANQTRFAYQASQGHHPWTF